MKRNRLFPAICLVAALLLSACSQDELAENSTALPKGEYPLQIGSVTLTAEVSEQPWTRVSENLTDGMSSEFQAGDAIGVNLNGETATYTYDGSAWTSETPLYWKDKQPATITAWYPVKEELDFTHQDQGLTYLLQATGDGNYQSTPINLNFTHKLAKVRVELTGTKSNEVQQVYVRSYPTSTHSHGTLDSQDRSLTPQYVPMRKATYGDMEYWEANLRPGYLDENNSFQVANADGVRVQVKQGRVDIKAGHVHTIKINVGEAQQVTGDISDDGTYIVSGTRTEPVTITGGNPTIYLENADISVNSGNAIDITGGASPTIHVMGENTVTNNSSTAGAGIYVAQGSTVTITGSSREDKLTATGGGGGAGIGGYYSYNNPSSSCGDIYISNVTIIASGSSSAIGDCASGIGAAGSETVGSINISNAVVYATGTGNINYGAAAIGGGVNNMNFGNKQTEFNITISDSEVHATKGSSYASYIGMAGDRNTSPANYDIISTAQITNSTIYNKSGTEITQ